jgi:predicted nuclease of predicted toxin-antitoxin system
MLFLIDENVPVQIIEWLHNSGHDATRVPAGTKNGKVLALAISESRVLLTQDKDFTNTVQYIPS